MKFLVPQTVFSPKRLARSLAIAAGVATILGFPLHLVSYAIRHHWTNYGIAYFLRRVGSFFQEPFSHDPVDAVEWVMIATGGGLCGLIYYFSVRVKGMRISALEQACIEQNVVSSRSVP